ncbi:epithelial cell adhesion molecule [Colossoma macropomum]|uniref:epithelial cell adhesion molecule n=1 Tax=Colossoma macropomum TaxID=42526 RepID=UPI001864EE0D|nr:epithelial cell adhesion molecule [Colossoma macropomum]XP_036429708.1 epithelial cell adhesion molecule [Colossoma macropomum]
MRTLIALCLLAFVAGASAQCVCSTMKWATCDGSPCVCTLPVDDNVKVSVDCTKLIPKCFLMKAEMYRARNKLDTRSSIGGKPVETAFVDNDGIYDPECESTGQFKAVQCNRTETCWCVNSAGVRRSDKGDKNIKCEPVETYWVRLQLKHKQLATPLDDTKLKTGVENAILERYSIPKNVVEKVEYDKDARLIVVDVKKEMGNRDIDLSRMAYYMEKDVKILPLFRNQSSTLQLSVGGTKVELEDILVYYVDEKAPTFTMKSVTGGVIAVIVVVVLAVVIGLLVLFFLRKRERAHFQKTQQREMDPMSS